MDSGDVRLSKLLALVLRHDPELIGLTLDPAGWVPVDRLLDAAAAHGIDVDEADLRRIVAASDKQRCAIDERRRAVRANHGHSIPVDLGLEPLPPPEELYHGTASRFLDRIRGEGLRPMGRLQVHLSTEVETARQVGGRHGRPRVLVVAAGRMAEAGFDFFRSSSGVWLTPAVPPEYLSEVAAERSTRPL